MPKQEQIILSLNKFKEFLDKYTDKEDIIKVNDKEIKISDWGNIVQSIKDNLKHEDNISLEYPRNYGKTKHIDEIYFSNDGYSHVYHKRFLVHDRLTVAEMNKIEADFKLTYKVVPHPLRFFEITEIKAILIILIDVVFVSIGSTLINSLLITAIFGSLINLTGLNLVIYTNKVMKKHSLIFVEKLSDSVDINGNMFEKYILNLIKNLSQNSLLSSIISSIITFILGYYLG